MASSLSSPSQFAYADDVERGISINSPGTLVTTVRSAPDSPLPSASTPPSPSSPAPKRLPLSHAPVSMTSSASTLGSPLNALSSIPYLLQEQDMTDVEKKGELVPSSPVVDDKIRLEGTHIEKALPAVKPKTPQAPVKHSPWIRFQLMFTVYRKFFVFVFTLNIIGIGLAASGHFPYAAGHTGAMLLGNLLCAVMMRNELFLRILYVITNTVLPQWSPLCIRLAATSALQHIGGIHSGCASSGLAWILYKVIMLIKHRTYTARSVLAMGLVTNAAIIISVVSAFPWIRNAHHNVFERHHRFIGWLGLASTWVFVILGNCYNPDTGVCEPNARHLISIQEFWFAGGMTVFIVLPWLFTRRVPVEVEIPSNKVAILRFNRGMQQGLLGRVSRTTLMEYHAFGIISEGTHAKYHYMVCGVQGDFTKGLVSDPPKMIWTREIKFAGVSNTSKLYRRGIRVCTGTGIGAALSTCLQNDGWFLIWIGSDQLKTFGPTIHGLIVNNIPPERRILWDSKEMGGRPDTMNLLEETYKSWGAEVVFITSNDQGNRDMMLGCKERGIPAFGTLFDF